MELANRPSESVSEATGDLKACDSEPLQFIGSIQSHGGLIAFTADDQRIQAASENIKDLTGVAHRETIAAKLSHVIGKANAEDVLDACRGLTEERPRTSIALEMNGKEFDGSVFMSARLHFLEIEELEAGHSKLKERLKQEDELKNCFSELRSIKQLEKQAFTVCRAVQRITGLDRVMMYRFLAPNNHGEVIAEHRVLSAHSFLQHRFPASDIPKIARDLYLRNGVRLIPDTELRTFSVTPENNPFTGKALDLSDSRLRAVSPIHLEYLRNMKVRCSFSVAVVVDGKLWGLIACHHLSPKRLTISQRNACELIANAFAGVAGLVEISDTQDVRLKFDRKLRDVLDSVIAARNPGDELMKRHQSILEAFDATGAALVTGETCDLVGLCPPREQVRSLSKAIRLVMQKTHTTEFAADSIPDRIGDTAVTVQLASGVLAVATGADSMFLLFRPEIVEKIVWGGDPRKQLDRKGFEGRINPRSSFETWEETIKGRSQSWADFEKEGFKHLAITVFQRLGTGT